MKNHRKILAVLLMLGLGLPNPALALRAVTPAQTGLEEEITKSLRAETAPSPASTGLEEVRVLTEKELDTLKDQPWTRKLVQDRIGGEGGVALLPVSAFRAPGTTFDPPENMEIWMPDAAFRWAFNGLIPASLLCRRWSLEW